jgi:membrane protease subunit (stomatin/prohibitin family)
MMMGMNMANEMMKNMKQNQEESTSKQETQAVTTNQKKPNFCPNCGEKTSGANFCSNCGQKLV